MKPITVKKNIEHEEGVDIVVIALLFSIIDTQIGV